MSKAAGLTSPIPSPIRSELSETHRPSSIGARLILAAGLLAWSIPPLVSLARTNWTTEAGEVGPLVLATGTWILVVEMRRAARAARPGNAQWSLLLLAVAVVLYLPSLAIMMVPALCVAAWLGLVAVLYGLAGWQTMRACWFPLLYLLLLVPLPYGISIAATTALRGWLSVHAVWLASLAGLEVAVNGNAVFVDQYRLAVEAACAGLNSTVSLLSVGLLYAYSLRRAAPWRVVLAIFAAVPIAIVANLMRILLLLFAVHLAGSGVLATPIHPLSGFLSFTLAFLTLAALDHGLVALRRSAT